MENFVFRGLFEVVSVVVWSGLGARFEAAVEVWLGENSGVGFFGIFGVLGGVGGAEKLRFEVRVESGIF